MTAAEAASGLLVRGAGARFNLSALSEDERGILESVASRVRFASGAVVINEGLPTGGLFLVVSGELEVSVRTESGQLTLTRVRRGQFLGEVAWFTGAPRSARAVALGSVEVLEFSRETLPVLLARAPALAYQLLQALAVTLAGRVQRLARQQYWLATGLEQAEADAGDFAAEGDTAAELLPESASRPPADVETRAALARVLALRGLPIELVDALLEVSRVEELHPGDVLWRQDDPGQTLLLPVTAGLEVTASFPGRPAFKLGIIEPGDVAGEVGLFAGGLRTAAITTTIVGAVLTLDRAGLERMGRAHPAAACALLRHLCTVLSQRVAASNAVLNEAVSRSVAGDADRPQRLAAQLALRPRWTQDDVDWRLHRRARRKTERLMARFIADLERAEASAESLAAGLVEEAGRLVPPEYYRAFYIRQHDEEALHAATMTRYAALLGSAEGGSSGFTLLLDEARRERDLDERILLLFLGEELALLTFRTLARSYPDPLLRQLLDFIVVDESTHVAFGHRLVQELMARRSRSARLRLVLRLAFSRLTPAIVRAFWDYRGLAYASGFPLGRLYAMYARAQAQRAWSIVFDGSFARVGA
ncbi:MAG: cyclic nucleotide-binding domain-containing protein [Dehalococcoidia bacterium]